MKNQLHYLVFSLSVIFFASGTNAQVINAFPYEQDFESFTNCGTGCGASCILSQNWTNNLGDDLDWLTDVGGTSSSTTGPTVDHTLGNSAGKYLYVETSCSGTGYPTKTANLLSPTIDLTGTNDVQFEFWYHMYGTTMGTLHIDLSTDGGVTWTNDIVPAWTDNLDIWQQSPSISLGAWSGSVVTIRLRFVTGTNFYSDVAVDDFHIYDLLAEDAGISAMINPQLPTCAFNDSVEVALTNFGTDTLTSVNIDWEWNATPQTQVAWTGNLAPGATENVYLGSVTYTDGDILSAYTGLPNGVIEPTSGNGNDTTTITVSTGLNGTYTIGATGDFLSFTEAVTALNMFGVCGPVIMNVQDGTYNEQIVLSEVIGMNATNTVTFQSENSDPALVTLDWLATTTNDNYVVQMGGADYFHFNNITFQSSGPTYGHVFEVTGGASFNEWNGNVIKTANPVFTTSTNMALVYSTSGGSIDSMNVFDGNTFENGSYSMYWYGDGTTTLEGGTVITNNDFMDFYYRGTHLYYQENIEVSNNSFTPGTTYTGSIYRLYMVYCDGASQVSGNDVRGMNYGYGIYVSNSDAPVTEPARFYNNFVHVGDTATTSTSYGLYFTGSANQHIINNSVNIQSNGTSSRAFYNTGGSNSQVYNNIFSNMGPGYAMYYINGGVSNQNNNNFWAPNGILFYFGGDINDLGTWQAATGFDNDSDTLNPQFSTPEDLHTCQSQFIDAGAMPYAWLTMDFDGQMRDSFTPDIGADEFLGLDNLSFASDTLWKCTNEALVLGGWQPTDDAISYLWNTTENTPTVSVTAAGIYSVLIATACGQTNPTTVVQNIPDAVAGFNLFTSFLTAQCTNTSSDATSYLWDFGDGNTSTDENPTHIYADTGDYVITLTVTGPCGTDVITQNMNANLVSVDELPMFASLEVYPNPNNGSFTIDMNVNEGMNVAFELTDVRGAIVWSSDAGSIDGAYTQNVQLSNQSEGMYFLKIVAGEHETVRKMIIK
ncbi:PKD domain-containing protein [Crocinitomicaceae bacterium]|nr:PKD domain-containing protein [Crocinitomicaceae bacterium]MDB3906362.1 PKD domain-containing protein [Crocinitomicaceae bacterium]